MLINELPSTKMCIYKLTHKPSKRLYIGKTINPLRYRLSGHHVIRRLGGIKNFDVEVMATASNMTDLPTPRLELRLKIIEIGKDRYNRASGSWEWTYSIVYKHLLGHIVKIPLGSTKSNGCFSFGLPSLPFRDSAHIRHDSESLGLPAYIIRSDKAAPLEEVDE